MVRLPSRADHVGSLLRPVELQEARDKMAVLGLVTSKTGALEDQDALQRRIDEATQYVTLDQLALSPQCGFASTEEGNLLTYDQQRAKLEMVVEVAEEVWGGS